MLGGRGAGRDSSGSVARIAAWLGLAGVLLAAIIVFGLPAGRAPVWNPDAARFMLLARDIVEHGRWLVPDLRGQPYLNKPQLFFWSIALASLPGGEVTERTAALPGVLSAVATVGGVAAIGTRVWGWHVGVLAALALITAPAFFAVAHHGQADLMVAAWTTWALYALLAARRSGWRLGPVVAFWACVAGAMMSKGPVGLTAAGAAAVSVAATDGWRALARLRPLIGAAVLAVLLAPWWVAYLTTDPTAFAAVVTTEYGGWVFRRGLLHRLESLWLAAYFLPWTLFLIAAMIWWRRADGDLNRRAIGWWALAMWAMIGLSGIHRVRYVVPIYPGFALLVAEFIVRGRDPRATVLLRRASLGVIALMVAVAMLSLTPVADLIEGAGRPWVPDTRIERAAGAALLLISAGAALLALRRRALEAVGLAVALGVAAVLLLEGAGSPPRFARDFDVRPLTAAALAVTPPGTAVAAYPDLPLTYDFYLRAPVVELGDEAAVTMVSQPPRGAIILPPRAWRGLAPRAHAAWEVLAVHYLGGKPMLVIGRGPPRPGPAAGGPGQERTER
jgi:4-amino-4-deoxy-L-arabinose transferase-like glycosyltransferase